MENVDPLLKLLHGPSLRRYLLEGAQELACSPGSQGLDALRNALFFVTVASLSEEACVENLAETKNIILSRFRSGTEIALAKADFVVSEDISTLQALVLYLFAVRSNENSRRIWTLTSLAVRIAHGLGLHHERYGETSLWPHSQFDCEMRRRLWWQICNLDRLGMSDRGSDPIIIESSFNTEPPLNIDDEDLIPGSDIVVKSQNRFTDTTFASVILEAFSTERRLNTAAVYGTIPNEPHSPDPWAQRRAWVIDCQRTMEDKYIRHCDSDIVIQRFAIQVADIMNARLWLWAYRPLHRPANVALPTKIPYPGILHFAVEVVEKTAQIGLDAAFERYLWISNIWVQWHALAVMLAELCVQTQGPIVERAWAVAPFMFDETARHVADSAKGRLWSPIKKLMSKAQAVRKQYLEDIALASSLGPIELDTRRAQHHGVVQSEYQPVTHPGLHMDWSNHTPQELQTLPPQDPTSLRQTEGPQFPTVPPQNFTSQPNNLGWEAWLNGTGSLVETDDAINVDKLSWNDWESFIHDFQAPGDIVSPLD